MKLKWKLEEVSLASPADEEIVFRSVWHSHTAPTDIDTDFKCECVGRSITKAFMENHEFFLNKAGKVFAKRHHKPAFATFVKESEGEVDLILNFCTDGTLILECNLHVCNWEELRRRENML